MKACGHSLWAVPYNYMEIARKYNMTHIPHIPLENNLAKPSNSIDLYNRVTLNFDNRLVRIKSNRLKMECAGIYCTVNHINYKTPYHFMPVWFDYDGNYDVIDEFPGKFVDAKIFRANTLSDNPSEWFLE